MFIPQPIPWAAKEEVIAQPVTVTSEPREAPVVMDALQPVPLRRDFTNNRPEQLILTVQGQNLRRRYSDLVERSKVSFDLRERCIDLQ